MLAADQLRLSQEGFAGGTGLLASALCVYPSLMKFLCFDRFHQVLPNATIVDVQ